MFVSIKKNIVLVATFLICLSGVALWWSNTRVLNGSGAPERGLYACNPLEIKRVKLVRQGRLHPETITMQKVSDPIPGASEAVQWLRASWEITEPDLGEADTGLVHRIVAGFCNLPRAQRVKKDGRPAFGKPRLELYLYAGTEEDSRSVAAFIFGQTLKQQRQVMARFSADEAASQLLTVPLGLYQTLNMPRPTYRNRKVLRMSLDSIHKVALEREQEKIELVREGADWTVHVNGEVLGRGNASARRFVNRLGTLRALSVVKAGMLPEECSQKVDASVKVRIEGVGNRQEWIRFSEPQQIIADRTAEKLLVCGSARTSLFGVHKDMWQYLAVRGDDLVHKTVKQ